MPIDQTTSGNFCAGLNLFGRGYKVETELWPYGENGIRQVRGCDSFGRNGPLPLPEGIQGAITIPMGFFECLGMVIISRNSLKFRLLVDSNRTLPPVFFDGLAQCSQIGYTRTHYEYYARPVRGPEPIRAHA